MNRTMKVFFGILFSVITFLLGSAISISNPVNLAIASFGAPWGVMFVCWPIMAFVWSGRGWIVVFALMLCNSISGILYFFVFYDFSSMLQLQHRSVGALSIVYVLCWVVWTVYIYMLIWNRAELWRSGR